MKVALIGAYGYTGTLICSELIRLNIPFEAVGRDKIKMDHLREVFPELNAYHVRDLNSETDVQFLIDNFDVFINCAGPFDQESKRFLTVVAKSGKAYFDISGESNFVLDSYVDNNEEAKRNKSHLFHATAFESAIIECFLATIGKFETIDVFYRFSSKNTSPGTRITLKLSKFKPIIKFREGEFQRSPEIDTIPQVDFMEGYGAISYPLPEVCYAGIRKQSLNISTYLLLPKDEVKFIGPQNKLEQDGNAVYERLKKNKKTGPTAEIRAGQVCELFVKADHTIWKAITKDMYNLTAEVMVKLVADFIKDPITEYGVMSPARVVKGNEEEFLNSLNIQFERIT